MKKYSNIGDLICDVRRYIGKSRNAMAEWLGVDPKSYRRWTNGEVTLSKESIEIIADKTKIPLEVLVRLNNSYPTYYNKFNHRYSLCPFDNDFINKKVLREQLFDNNERANISTIHSEQDIREVIDSLFPIYTKINKIEASVMKYIFKNFVDFNLIIKDHMNYYNGHLISFPMSTICYNRIRSREINEAQISREFITNFDKRKPVVIYIYSLFATSSTFAYHISKKFIEKILLYYESRIHPESVIARYVVTNDGLEHCDKMGMKFVYADEDAFDPKMHEIDPTLFESRICDMDWMLGYKEKLIKSKYRGVK